jgi:hypothetical protein
MTKGDDAVLGLLRPVSTHSITPQTEIWSIKLRLDLKPCASGQRWKVPCTISQIKSAKRYVGEMGMQPSLASSARIDFCQAHAPMRA